MPDGVPIGANRAVIDGRAIVVIGGPQRRRDARQPRSGTGEKSRHRRDARSVIVASGAVRRLKVNGPSQAVLLQKWYLEKLEKYGYLK